MNTDVNVEITVNAEQIALNTTRNLDTNSDEKKEIDGDKIGYTLGNDIGSLVPLQNTPDQVIQRAVLERSAGTNVSSNVAATCKYYAM